MTPESSPQLAAVEATLWRSLRTYQPPLIDSTIYNIPSLAWPGVKKHDCFAAVKPATKHVALLMAIMERYPEELDTCSPALLAKRTGKATLQFRSLDGELLTDLEALLARLFARYRADHEGQDCSPHP